MAHVGAWGLVGRQSRKDQPKISPSNDLGPTGPSHLAPLWRTRFGKLTQHGPPHLLPITSTECSCSMTRTRHSSARLPPQPVWTDFARYGQTSLADRSTGVVADGQRVDS